MEEKNNAPIRFNIFSKSDVSTGAKSLLLAGAFLEQEEQKHWKHLQELFTNKKQKNFIPARSCILDIHLSCDRNINLLLEYLLIRAKRGLTIGKKVNTDGLSNALFKLEISKRIKIVVYLGIFSQNSMEAIGKINEIRNAFAHHIPEDNKVFIYKNKSIFTLEGIEKITEDYVKVLEETIKILKLIRDN